MANAKFVKTAAAVALGTSVVATAVAPSASAATTYKIKSGKLVNAKTGKVVKGYKTYKSVLYKDGKKYTGLRSGKYYKAGVLSTGTYKGVKYKKGVKFTGISTNGKYYKNGKLGTGTYKNVKYKNGEKFTGISTADKKFYKNGKLGTGTYQGVKYKNGEKFSGVSTNGKLYENGLVFSGDKDGKKYVDGLLLNGKDADGVVYVDGVKDEVAPEITAEDKTVEYDSAAVDVNALATVKDNSGEEIKATATITFDGKEVSAIDTKTPGKYTVTYVAKDANGNEGKKEITVTVAEAPVAAVESVKVLSATQVEVKFSKALDKDTVAASDFVLKSLDGKAQNVTAAELSKDGKTVTLTTGVLEGRYDLTIDGLKDVDGKDAVKYEAKNLDFGKDTTAPEIAGTEKVNATTTKVNFSEPLADKGSWTFKDEAGKAVTATTELSADGKYVTVVITDADVKAGTTITATVLGAKDKNTNVINPNPSTVTFVKGDKDGVAPTVASVTATSLTTFEVKFSEEVQNLTAANVTVDGTAVTSITPDENDKTKYVVVTPTVVAGLHTVKVASTDTVKVTDLSGEELTAFSKLVEFKADTVKPAFVSSEVVVNADTKKEQLVLNFDKEVTTTALTNVEFTKLDKDLVTTTGKLTAGSLTQNPKNKKQLIVDLADVKAASADLEKGATYTLSFAKDAVADAAGNKSEAFEVKFVRGEDGTATTSDKPVVSNVAVKDSTTVEVTFDKEVEGATATNAANYTIPNVTVEKAVLNPVDATAKTQSVTLTLAKGSNNLNGDRVLTIANIKAKNGEVMDTVSKTVTLKENVAPTATAAKFSKTANGKVTQITVDFSEAVTVLENSLEVYVGDAKTPVATTTAAVSTAADKAVVVITENDGLTTEDIAKGITVKTADGKEVVDVNGNKAAISVKATK